jgi:hypothetical protein
LLGLQSFCRSTPKFRFMLFSTEPASSGFSMKIVILNKLKSKLQALGVLYTAFGYAFKCALCNSEGSFYFS